LITGDELTTIRHYNEKFANNTLFIAKSTDVNDMDSISKLDNSKNHLKFIKISLEDSSYLR